MLCVQHFTNRPAAEYAAHNYHQRGMVSVTIARATAAERLSGNRFTVSYETPSADTVSCSTCGDNPTVMCSACGSEVHGDLFGETPAQQTLSLF